MLKECSVERAAALMSDSVGEFRVATRPLGEDVFKGGRRAGESQFRS